MRLNKEAKDFMKGRFGAVTQVSLALLLSLSLGFMTAMPSMAQESAQRSASISPSTEVYDLGDPDRADIKTTITWHDAQEIAGVEDDGGALGENDYSVTRIDDNRATLSINGSYLKRRLQDITDRVVLTVRFDFGDPATLVIAAVRYPAISPQAEEYDLDDPPDFIKTSITWGRATDIRAIADGEGELIRGPGNDYIVLLSTLLILNDYLKAKLEEDGDKVELTVEFNVGDPVTLTIASIKTYPDLKATPNPAAYNLFPPTHVEIVITWHKATRVVSIIDDNGHSLQSGRRPDYTVVGTTLTVLSSYLEGRVTKEGDTVVLTIAFDIGNPIGFTIRAVDGTPSIAPETAEYDLDDPADVNTTIIWGAATEVVSITANDNNLSPENHYTVHQTVEGEAKLTILSGSYLKGKLGDIGARVELTIKFAFDAYPGLEHDVTFAITAIGTHPRISPSIAPYDLRSPAAVNTTITWRNATEVVSVVDSDGNTLEEGNEDENDKDYRVIAIDGDTATLTILGTYLTSNLTNLRAAGDSVVLTIGFDFGQSANFTITAVDEYPSITPEGADYDLDQRGNVQTTITWQASTQVVSITENASLLIREDHYTVEDIIEGETATLTILSASYLKGRLSDIGDKAVLTIEFNVGDPVTFTITAVRSPAIDPTTAMYDLDDRADFIEIRITWGSAGEIVEIIDDNGILTRGQPEDYLNSDYIVLGNTLVITDEYLRKRDVDGRAVLDVDDRAVLSIKFDFGDPAALTIRAIGTHPRISPTYAVYDLDHPGAVQTTITWGSATEVVSITENNGPLIQDHYTVEQTVEGEATLIISDAYLKETIERYIDKVELSIEFDFGQDANFLISALGCFIATATYDTPMAGEIRILRAFRDGYLLTNPLGESLVGLYYRVSPPIAGFITEHPTLKPMVRVGLLPAVAGSTVVVNTTPAERMAIVALLTLALAVPAVWATKRRGRGPEYT